MEIISRRTWAEINIDALKHNIDIIKSYTSPKALIMAVVKADAYGHGAAEISRVALQNGASYLAVSMLDEAMELRSAGIKAPILILSDSELESAESIVENDIRQGVYNYEMAQKLSEAAIKTGKNAKIHLKIDTGMGRIGFVPENAAEMAEKISQLPGIEIEGIFTHFAVADEYSEKSNEYTKKQFNVFYNVCEKIEKEKHIHIKLRHACNSAGILRYPEMHLDMVRAGIIMYGLWPSSEVEETKADIKAIMTLKSTVSHVKKVEKGTCLSYGCTYCTDKEATIATIPVGYADGYMRTQSNRGYIYHEKSNTILPIRGRVCMDQMMVDASKAANSSEGIKIGDTVVLFGDYIEDRPTAQSLGNISNTISYEVVCAVSRRVPRIYIENGSIIKISNRLI